ncbi:MAG: hypothetical protein ACRYG7_00530 [Janthinobacterium lividum]
MLRYPKSLFLLLWLLLGSQLTAHAIPRVAIVLQVDPPTYTFTCRSYTITVPAADMATVLRLNLLRQWQLQRPTAPAQVGRVCYPYFSDTVQQAVVRYPYGSVHDESDWLNEAFATYSSMLYLQAKGDTAGYRQNYDKLAQTIPNTPPIIGFDRTKYEPGMYRRVAYNKGMVVLAALHARVGTTRFYDILATTPARRVPTTTALLDVVGQVAGPETRAWLQAELST